MTSPIRVYNFIHRIFKTEAAQLINLNKVSSIELKNKCITFTLDEKEPIFGFIMIVGGGGSVTRRIYFDTHERAKTEFEDIQNHMDKFLQK
jgi:hypothetical protein